MILSISFWIVNMQQLFQSLKVKTINILLHTWIVIIPRFLLDMMLIMKYKAGQQTLITERTAMNILKLSLQNYAKSLLRMSRGYNEELFIKNYLRWSYPRLSASDYCCDE